MAHGNTSLTFASKKNGLEVVVLQDKDLGYFQSQRMNRMMHAAYSMWGLDMIILPFDADEIFVSVDPSLSLVEALRSMGQGLTHAPVYDHVPSISDEYTGNPCYDIMWREPNTKALPSVAFSYDPTAVIMMGNHDASHIGPAREGLIKVHHFQYRGLEHYIQKMRNGKTAMEATDADDDTCLHWRVGGGKTDAELEAEWIRYTNQSGLIYDPAPVKGIK